jgi:hypothetical protein
MAGRPPGCRLGSAPDDAGLRCHDCGRRILGAPHFSVTGRSLCWGCAERLDAATMALMTANGACGTGATAAWLDRARRSRAPHARSGEAPR